MTCTAPVRKKISKLREKKVATVAGFGQVNYTPLQVFLPEDGFRGDF